MKNLFVTFVTIIALLVLISGREAFSYPNMVRHGYTTCVTCHFNASGGGSLRSYGKYVAGETMGVFNDSGSALRWIKDPKEDENYSVAFLGRTVQTLFDTPQLKRGDFRKMQADLEGAVEYKTWVGLVTAGPRLDSIDNKDKDYYVFSRRYYVGKQTMNYSVKAGKFFPEFGLNLPNHNVPTRKGLFFNHNQEPHTIQGSYFTPSFDFTAAHIRGAKDTQFAKMAGLAGTVAYKRGSTRVGISQLYYNFLGGPQESMATSLFATVGYFSKGYTMFEGARKRVKNARKIKTDTNVAYLESGWEVYKGFIPYFNWEYSKNVTLKSKSHSPGLGVQLGLITHLELVAQYQRLYTPQGDGWAVYSMLNAYF